LAAGYFFLPLIITAYSNLSQFHIAIVRDVAGVFSQRRPRTESQEGPVYVMEVKSIARHIAEIVLFNWVDQIHQLLLQY
jgi:Tfp pilus assembly pilus retraction ATPase PilT